MKKSFLLSTLFAATLLTTGCSDDKDLVQQPTPVDNGESYMSLAIQLPNQVKAKSRAESFNDGLKEEYDVKDATLILFRGTSESTAKFVNSYNMDLKFNKDNDDKDQITSVAEIVQAIKSTDKPTTEGENLYAFVVLNNSQRYLRDILDQATTDDTFQKLFGSSNIISTPIDIDAGFVMTNAPLATSLTGETYTVLSEIDSDRIYADPDDAKGRPAAVVHVERNVAKVTVNGTNGVLTATGGTDNLKDADGQDIKWKVMQWALDNTAPSTYFQRQIENPSSSASAFSFEMPEWYNYISSHLNANRAGSDGKEPSRFIGNTWVGTTGLRIYWGYSPRYSTDATDLLKASSTSASPGDTNPLYCYENTFDVAHQTESHTTQALIQMQINGGKDFYTVKDEYWGKADGSDTNLKKKVIMLLAANPTVQSKMGTVFTPTVANSTVDFTTSGTKTKVTESTVVLGDGSHTLTFTDDDALQAVVNDYFNKTTEPEFPITCYPGGLNYYRVLIKHFGDEGTPWNAADHIGKAVYDDGDGTLSEQNYLGRYGVLRNNWYNINITKVAGFGSPTVPTIPTPGGDDPSDDVVKSYVAVEIKILSWAKRDQDAELE